MYCGGKSNNGEGSRNRRMGSADHLRLTVKNKQRRWSSSSRVRSRFWVFPTFTQTVIWVAVVGLHLWNWKHTRKKIEYVRFFFTVDSHVSYSLVCCSFEFEAGDSWVFILSESVIGL